MPEFPYLKTDYLVKEIKMGTNLIVITVERSKYKIGKNGMSDFALIGVLECILTGGRKLESMPDNPISTEQKI